MLKAVIFDFDGVIADSEILHYKALAHAFASYDLDMPKEIHYEKYLGYSDFDNIYAVSRDFGRNWNESQVQDIFNIKTAKFESLAATESIIIEGVVDLVRRLEDAGLALAICSGATRRDIDQMLAGSGIENSFSVIITADDVEKGKPDPEGYLMALKKLNESMDGEGITPAECLVVEDSMWGLEAAKAAGMKKLGVTTTYTKEKLQPLSEMVVESYNSLDIDHIRSLFE